MYLRQHFYTVVCLKSANKYPCPLLNEFSELFAFTRLFRIQDLIEINKYASHPKQTKHESAQYISALLINRIACVNPQFGNILNIVNQY